MINRLTRYLNMKDPRTRLTVGMLLLAVAAVILMIPAVFTPDSGNKSVMDLWDLLSGKSQIAAYGENTRIIHIVIYPES